ncbi:ceramide synthase 5-like [Tenebrio molitor]|uniref:ceramide synthase 5-like n=1 Tax=Tenebrio molitor TaxID=7067 RepID=UPI0036247F84
MWSLCDANIAQCLPKVSINNFTIQKYIFSALRYIFTKIGLRLGLKQIEVKKAPHHAALEKAYSISKKWKLDRIRGLAKQLDVSEEEVESWLKLRSAQDTPSVLTKFSESFWRCCYYTSAWTAAVLIVWDKPWFWDLDQCWTEFLDQAVTRDVWWHLMITLSFYLSELMGLYLDVKRKDFWPMFIHHVTSIVLFAFVWKSNFHRLNMVGLVLFDCCDILLEVLFSTEVIKMLQSCCSCPKL